MIGTRAEQCGNGLRYGHYTHPAPFRIKGDGLAPRTRSPTICMAKRFDGGSFANTRPNGRSSPRLAMRNFDSMRPLGDATPQDGELWGKSEDHFGTRRCTTEARRLRPSSFATPCFRLEPHSAWQGHSHRGCVKRGETASLRYQDAHDPFPSLRLTTLGATLLRSRTMSRGRRA